MKIIECGKIRTFREISLAFQDALLDMGYKSKICNWVHLWNKKYKCRCDDLKPDKFNIYIHGRETNINLDSSKTINICFQTEQLFLNRHKLSNRNKWDKILEIFPTQTNYPNTVFFPLGYSKHFDSNIKQKKETIDFFTFGAKTLYRKQWEKLWPGLFYKNGYGEERDNLIIQSKLNINLKAYNKYYFAPIHALFILCKGKILLQEKTEEYGMYKDYIIPFDKSNFKKISKYWLSNNEERIEKGKEIQKDLKNNHHFTDYFKEAMKGIL